MSALREGAILLLTIGVSHLENILVLIEKKTYFLLQAITITLTSDITQQELQVVIRLGKDFGFNTDI